MSKINKEDVKKFIEKEYPKTPQESYDIVYAMIDEYNKLEDFANRHCEDECQNFVTLQSSQMLSNLFCQQDAIKQKLYDMGINNIQ